MLRQLAALLVLPTVLAAQAKPHGIDKAHSEINFIADARFFAAHGYFGNWDADVLLDRADMTKSVVNITIDVKSITTRNDMRDRHLKTPDFFAADSFPNITFTSKKITPAGEHAWVITGDLTIRSTKKEIEVPVREVFYDEGKPGEKGPAALGRGRYQGEFSVLRKEYGLLYDSRINPVENKIVIQWEMALVEKKAP
ncbi:MAG: YceI family protein [Gemmatimonadetes bacterium]|nr:YceI family protein [Gemmatimonadota bacterium]